MRTTTTEPTKHCAKQLWTSPRPLVMSTRCFSNRPRFQRRCQNASQRCLAVLGHGEGGTSSRLPEVRVRRPCSCGPCESGSTRKKPSKKPILKCTMRKVVASTHDLLKAVVVTWRGLQGGDGLGRHHADTGILDRDRRMGVVRAGDPYCVASPQHGHRDDDGALCCARWD